eukprot:gene5886-6809_t
MSPTIITVTDTSKFHQTVAEALATNESVFVEFISTQNTEGVFWCKACVTADPIFKQAFANIPTYTLIVCSIESEGYRGNPDHVYKKDGLIQLNGIPTLMSWTKAGPGLKYSQEEKTVENVTAFLQSQL